MNSVTQDTADSGQPSISPFQANYLLIMLTVAYCMAYIDRQMLNLLVDPIRDTLIISDTEFSFLQGTAFVIAYLAAAPIFGRLVDVANRKLILIFGVFSWSAFTAVSGLCDTYTELFMARMGVGITEACIFPVAWSLIGDAFSNERQPRALSIFLLAPQLGGGLSLIAGGLIIGFAASLVAQIPVLASLEPWQMAFVVTGVPGIAFALLLFTLVEPKRTSSSPTAEDHNPSLGEVFSHIGRHSHLYVRMYLAIGVVAIVTLVIPSWLPAFMIRAHGLTAAETGLRLGIIASIVGPISTISGPLVAEWFRKRGNPDAPLQTAAWITPPMILCSFLLPLMPGPNSVLVLAGALIFCCGFPVGMMAGATQVATPPRMRGVVASIYTFAAQVIGYMIGPTLVALITDQYFGDDAMVGRSLQIVMTGAAIIAAYLLFSVIPHYRRIMSERTGETAS